MAGRRTNLGLLVLLAWAIATGGLAFAIGAGWNRWVTMAHGALGVGVLLLTPWKSAIARRGLRRRRPGWGGSVALAAAVALAIVSAVVHSTGLIRSAAGVTAIQVHVGAALASVPLAAWHVVARRVRPRRTDLSRRVLLRAGALAAGSFAAYGTLAGVAVVADLPGRHRRFTGSYDAGSGHPERMPVTQWLTDRVPSMDPAAWSLALVLGDHVVRRLTFDQLDRMGEPVTAVLDCTGGWYAEQRWEGARIDRLLAGAGIDTAGPGRSLRAVSLTGYDRRFPLEDAPRLWLVTRVGGRLLSAGHGSPARIVAPGRRGFWWVKWVAAVHLDPAPWWWQAPFPLE